MSSGITRKPTVAVNVGHVVIGGGSPIVVQAMTNTDTADAESTATQCLELAQSGAELVRFTVNTHDAAAAVPEIRARLADSGCSVPLVGDFHYNGHILLSEHPSAARVLDKYRINPGNVGRRAGEAGQFETICRIAADLGKTIRIGVNGGSLDQILLARAMQENTDRKGGKSSAEVIAESMVLSALESTELARSYGVPDNRIVISCKVSQPSELIALYRELSSRTRQPLHLGLTEAGMGIRGLVWSAAAMAVLLSEGIGDTIRVSLTPRPGGDRREEVLAARELLQSLALRTFHPTVTSCPGCGRTTSSTFQRLTERIEGFTRSRFADWNRERSGVASLRLAVMGCIVNGPGESKAANLGISLPGTGEKPACPVFVDGRLAITLRGSFEEVAAAFERIIEDYVVAHYPARPPGGASAGRSEG
jgi:(E)-4-hydroxy-3-methylbut-2-enyl-diphosphate synthase